MWGRQVLGNQSIQPTSVLAAGDGIYKPGGLTIDWSLVAAVSGSDVTLADGSVIKIGQKFLRFGQILTKVTSGGKFGPYDPAAVDGRQTLTRGECFIVERTIVNQNVLGFNTEEIELVGALEGGTLWLDRVIQSGVAAASLAAGPTKVNFLAAFPMVRLVVN